MSANASGSGRASLAVACSVVAAAAFAVLPVASAVSPGFKLPHSWLFAMGAVAFLSNLESRLHPAARAVAAVLQAMCVFEVFGFSMGLTVMAYAGPAISAAHVSAAAIVLSGMSPRCGKIEKSTTPRVLSSPVGGDQLTKSFPIRGVMTMLPALIPTQTVSLSEGRRSASPDCRIQWHR